MNYAVIKIQGHQEIVSEDTQQLVVDRVTEKEGSLIKPQVLLSEIEGNVQIGTPTVDFPVELEVIKHQRGDKIYVSRFHSKVRTRRRIGFRPEQTVLKVVKFGEKVKETVKAVKLPVKKTTKTKSSPKTKKTESPKVNK
jgi:ribosomal protein L21